MKNAKTKNKIYSIICAALLVLGTAGSSFALGGFFDSKDSVTTSGGNTGYYESIDGGDCGNNYKVPEPPTMLLLGTGLVGLAGIVRRRIKKN